MGSKVTLEFDKITNEVVYMENIIMNVHSNTLVSFQKNYQQIKEYDVQSVIKGAQLMEQSLKE